MISNIHLYLFAVTNTPIHLMPCTKHTKSKLRLQILIKCAACTVMMHLSNLALDISYTHTTCISSKIWTSGICDGLSAGMLVRPVILVCYVSPFFQEKCTFHLRHSSWFYRSVINITHTVFNRPLHTQNLLNEETLPHTICAYGRSKKQYFTMKLPYKFWLIHRVLFITRLPAIEHTLLLLSPVTENNSLYFAWLLMIGFQKSISSYIFQN
jgi:hypothetical protein